MTTEVRALTIRFPPDLYQEGIVRAETEDRTFASLVRAALRAYLSQR